MVEQQQQNTYKPQRGVGGAGERIQRKGGTNISNKYHKHTVYILFRKCKTFCMRTFFHRCCVIHRHCINNFGFYRYLSPMCLLCVSPYVSPMCHMCHMYVTCVSYASPMYLIYVSYAPPVYLQLIPATLDP